MAEADEMRRLRILAQDADREEVEEGRVGGLIRKLMGIPSNVNKPEGGIDEEIFSMAPNMKEE